MKEYKSSILSYAEKSGIDINKNFLEIFEEVKEEIKNTVIKSKLFNYSNIEWLKEEERKIFTRIFKFDDDIKELSLTWNKKNYFDLIRNTHSYEWRKLLWDKKYLEIWEYNKKIDYLIKEWIYKSYEINGSLKSEEIKFISIIDIINLLDLEILKNIIYDFTNIDFIFEAKISEDIRKYYKYIRKIKEKISINNLNDLVEFLALLKNNITYDKIKNNIELKQFYKNLYLIKKQIPNITKEYLSYIKYLLFVKEEELEKFLPYLTEENLYKYKNNLTYLIKNSLYSFNENNDFWIKKYDIEFSKEWNKDSIEACEWFEADTYNYLKFWNKNFYIIKIDWKIIWHVKDEAIKTFLAYYNIVDKNGNIVLLKWWIYNFDIWNLYKYDIWDWELWDCINKNLYRIINISLEQAKSIKIKFLRLISNKYYIEAWIHNPDNKLVMNIDDIWQDFELFKDEIYYNLWEEKK